MKLIQDNPYRSVGVLANSSEREMQRKIAKIKAYSKVGRNITFEVDFPILSKIDRTEQKVSQASANLEQNQDQLNHSIFWFLQNNTFDETAIRYLSQGDIEKAFEIWYKVTEGKEVSSKNISSFNNLGTLQLLGDTKDQIKKGIATKVKLIESLAFKEFVYIITDETHRVNKEKQLKLFIDQVLNEISGTYSQSEAIQLFEYCNVATQKYLSKKYTEEHAHNIESLIETTKSKRKDDVANAYVNGVYLFEQTQTDLQKLKAISGVDSLQYKLLVDNLAREVMQCGIDYFQHWKDNKDTVSESIALLKNAQTIAIGKQIKDRIIDNIAGITESKAETDFVFVTEKLEAFQTERASINNAKNLIRYCQPKLKNMKNILGKNNRTYLQFSGAIVNNAMSMLIEVVNAAQQGISYDRNKLLALPGIVSSATSVMDTLDTFDMETEAYKRYMENKKALARMNRELKKVQTHQTSEDGGGYGWIIYLVFFFLYLMFSGGC